MYEHRNRWFINIMCDILEVSETGYYRYVRSLDNPGKKDEVLSATMREVINESPFNDNYGIERMILALAQRGIKVGKRRATRIMRENGWLHERRRRPFGLTKATTEIQEQENLIKQNFHSNEPYQKLLTDISQVVCCDGKLYISPIMDCFNGEILSLLMRDNMRRELCIDTFKAAANRFPIAGATLHSDRGSQYTSEDFKSALACHNVSQSLSGVGHCYDNARMESFFATLKKELLYRMKKEQVKKIIFRYVFAYYNRIRIYTSNPEGLPPAAYRRKMEEDQLLAA
ncbi:IS3 family transposase [Mogibacterium sp. CM50]|uniref:IS3 family transposase n=1 Tax=Mogibacterium sp. CM50 TaxID=936375 RepID=UPI0012EA70AB|nr:IS3 family transposase [Mogibacterium sp. CM50]